MLANGEAAHHEAASVKEACEKKAVVRVFSRESYSLSLERERESCAESRFRYRLICARRLLSYGFQLMSNA
jgi:hypothetical protein